MTEYIPMLLTVTGVLVVVVNIIVQVIKPFTVRYISTNFVAYAAMFGFDKLKEAVSGIKK